MNWSRREMSAESVASTNEPLAGGGGGGGSHTMAAPAAYLMQSLTAAALGGASNSTSTSAGNHSPPAPLLPEPASHSAGHGNLVAAANAVTSLTAANIRHHHHHHHHYQHEQPLALALGNLGASNQLQQQQQSFSEWWDEYWSRQPFPSGYTQSSITLLACFISTFIFLIVVGNLLVCIAIFTEKSLKPTQNWFIASLAVSDMMLGLVVMPFSLARELMGFWMFGPLWCDIHEALDVLLTTASINTLCLISLDRYWSITQAVNYLKKRTPKRGAFMIAFVWFFSAAVSLPPLFGWKKQQSPVGGAPVAKQSPPSPPQPGVSLERATANGSSSGGGGNSFADDKVPARLNHDANDDDDDGDDDEFNSELSAPPSQQDSNWQRRRRRRRTRRQSTGLATPLPDQPMLGLHSMGVLDGRPANVVAIEQQPSPPPLPPISGDNYPTCQLSDDLGYVLYSALGSFYIPCAVMVFTYIKIFLAARSRARRAINKQSRGAAAAAAAASKRAAAAAANRRTAGGGGSGGAKQLASCKQSGCNASAISGSLSRLNASSNDQLLKDHHDHHAAAAAVNGEQPLQRPPAKGKLVIVERKKSLAALAAVAAAGASGTCSPLFIQPEAANEASKIMIKQDYAGHRQPDDDHDDGHQQQRRQQQLCTLTTSGVKQASPSALNRSASTDSSMITVMHSSMADVAVTRFNFRSEVAGQKQEPPPPAPQKGEPGQDRKAAALLQAIREISAQEQRHLAAGEEPLLLEQQAAGEQRSPVPDIVVERRAASGTVGCPNGPAPMAAAATEQSQALPMSCDEDGAAADPVNSELDEPASCCAGDGAAAAGGPNATSETCFMTIEEDSDMFEAQTGRTITMVASNASQRQTSNLAAKSQIVTMLPAGGGGGCNEPNCRERLHQARQQQQQQPATRSASSYCGSSITINDDDDDLDECVDDELLTDDCNGYSCATYDHYCTTMNEDSSCGPHCHECELAATAAAAAAGAAAAAQSAAAVAADDERRTCQSSRHLSIGASEASPLRKQLQARHHQLRRHNQQQQQLRHHQQQHQHHHHHQSQLQANSEAELQSITGDDNLSLTEYRSQDEDDERSSIIGHDVLDATETRHHSSEKKKQSISGPAAAAAVASERKKSSIGFRLARLGSTAPLSNYSGGLLALASSQQQQSSAGGGGGGVGTRNLKALRQNFFLKLNQLTAKSSSTNKQQQQLENKNKKASIPISPTGKSSAHSSGTSYEPSVDCATTSNIHSNEFNQETTMGEVDDNSDRQLQEQQHSPDETSSSYNNNNNNNSNKMMMIQQEHKQQQQQQQSQLNNNHENSNNDSNNNNNNNYDVNNSKNSYTKNDLTTAYGPAAAAAAADRQFEEQGKHGIAGIALQASSEQASSDRLRKTDASGGGQTAAAAAAAAAAAQTQMMNKMMEPSAANNSNSNTNTNNYNHNSNSNSNNRLLLHSSASLGPAIGGKGGKLQRFDLEQGGGGGATSTTKRRPPQSASGHLNYSSTMISSSSGQPASQRAYLASDNERHKRKLAKARERRATLILGLIMAAFICSWMPFFTFYVLRAVCSSCKEYVSPRFEAFIFWMGYCNSAINPIIYTIFNRDFRKAFRKILFKCL